MYIYIHSVVHSTKQPQRHWAAGQLAEVKTEAGRKLKCCARLVWFVYWRWFGTLVGFMTLWKYQICPAGGRGLAGSHQTQIFTSAVGVYRRSEETAAWPSVFCVFWLICALKSTRCVSGGDCAWNEEMDVDKVTHRRCSAPTSPASFIFITCSKSVEPSHADKWQDVVLGHNTESLAHRQLLSPQNTSIDNSWERQAANRVSRT